MGSGAETAKTMSRQQTTIRLAMHQCQTILPWMEAHDRKDLGAEAAALTPEQPQSNHPFRCMTTRMRSHQHMTRDLHPGRLAIIYHEVRSVMTLDRQLDRLAGRTSREVGKAA